MKKYRKFSIFFLAFFFGLGISALIAREDLLKLKEEYFKEHKYQEFVQYLEILKKEQSDLAAEANYYIALTRYQQLKYLEETQNWNEYFNSGNDYRQAIALSLQGAIAASRPQDRLGVLARCLLWQFHKDQTDALEEGSRQDLLNASLEYAKVNKDAQVLKYVAEVFFGYGNSGDAKKIYRLYAEKLIAAETNIEKIKMAAHEAYLKNNLPLSTLFYDAYIGKITHLYAQDQLFQELTEIARLFSHSACKTSACVQRPLPAANSQEPSLCTAEAIYDTDYAEKIFQKIAELFGTGRLVEELQYLRACNLEKGRDFLAARDQYEILCKNFPANKHYEEAIFKIGIINTYVAKDIIQGNLYFTQLLNRPAISPQVISALYQLGLLAQWQNDLVKAKDYYLSLIEKAADSFPQLQKLSQDRLKEIENNTEIEYNLKTFLEATFTPQPQVPFDMSRVELGAEPLTVTKGGNTQITASVYLPESGCMMVSVKYLWSGDTGRDTVNAEEANFTATYPETATNVVNLVVMASSGPVDRSIVLVDSQ